MADVRANTTSAPMDAVAEAVLDLVYLMRIPERVVVQRELRDGWRSYSFEPDATDAVDHPAHYGGDTVYEAIKVIEAWQLGFNLGNAVKYISRAGKKVASENPLLRPEVLELQDLGKARWYLDREIARLRGE